MQRSFFAHARHFLGQLALALATVATIGFTVDHVHPVYADRAPVVRRLLTSAWRDSVAMRAPWIQESPEAAMQTEQFDADRQAFAEDLLRTGRLDSTRADSLAGYAVREAYKRRLPPALVFGVMLTENDDFDSSARSSVGAVGLMQIYPKAWVHALGPHFGTDLRDDETNVRYGVYILSHLLYGVPDSVAPDSSIRAGLLRYNGCVHGTNTPHCDRYPDIVRQRIEQLAIAQCGDDGFERCVAQPLRRSLDESWAAW